MKLEQQVTSLELSKRLKELGVKQESYFWWSAHTIPETLWSEGWLDKAMEGAEQGDEWARWAAFTVAELGEMLPNMVDVEKRASMLTYCRNSAGTNFGLYGTTIDKRVISIEMITGPTEAEARGLMLEYLITNKLIAI